MSLDAVLKTNDRPAARQIADLREAVNWDRREKDYSTVLDRYDITVAAYDSEENLIGWCAAITDGIRHAFFVDVIVHPFWQRRGIGTSMVRKAIEEIRGNGITLAHVDFARERASFYEQCGFTICGGGMIEFKNHKQISKSE